MPHGSGHNFFIYQNFFSMFCTDHFKVSSLGFTMLELWYEVFAIADIYAKLGFPFFWNTRYDVRKNGISETPIYRVFQKKRNPNLAYIENTSCHNSNTVKSKLDALKWSVQNMEKKFS